MSIGQDLLDLPFAEVVRNLALAIADGQLALDRASLETLRALVNNTVDIIPEVSEIIGPDPRSVAVSVPDPMAPGGMIPSSIIVTGARITASAAPPVTMNLLQAGLLPTFYQFTEATIQVKLSISMRDVESSQVASTGSGSAGRGISGVLNSLGIGRKTAAYASPVNYRSANSYSYSAEGASVLTASMRPVPAPSRLIPRTVTVNTFTSPPTVTTIER